MLSFNTSILSSLMSVVAIGFICLIVLILVVKLLELFEKGKKQLAKPKDNIEENDEDLDSEIDKNTSSESSKTKVENILQASNIFVSVYVDQNNSRVQKDLQGNATRSVNQMETLSIKAYPTVQFINDLDQDELEEIVINFNQLSNTSSKFNSIFKSKAYRTTPNVNDAKDKALSRRIASASLDKMKRDFELELIKAKLLSPELKIHMTTDKSDIDTEGKIIFRVLTPKEIAKNKIKELLESAKLTSESSSDSGLKRKIYPDLKVLPSGDILIESQHITLTEADILKAVPRFVSFFNTTFDLNRVKKKGEHGFLVRRTVPIKNWLGFKKVSKVVIDEETKEETIEYSYEPETILDKYPEWIAKLSKSEDKKVIDNLASPKIYVGKNQVDDGTGIDDFFINTLEYAHYLIIAGTGGGKTEYLKSILYRLIYLYRPTINFYDGKGAPTWAEFAKRFSQFPLGVPQEGKANVSRNHDFYFMIERAYEEMMRRKKLFAEIGAENFVAYNKLKGSYEMTPFISVFDEWSFIMAKFKEDGDLKSPTPGSPHDKLMNIFRGGRSYGIMLFIVNQDGKDVDVPNNIKNNCRVKVIGKCDQKSANYLEMFEDVTSLEKGQLFIKNDEYTIKVKNDYIGSEDFITLLNKIPPYDIEKKPIDYDEIFTFSLDVSEPKNITRIFKKYLIKEGFSYNKKDFSENPSTAKNFIFIKVRGLLDEESNTMSTTPESLKTTVAFGYALNEVFELDDIKLNYENYPDVEIFVYIATSQKFINSFHKAKSDPAYGIRQNTFMINTAVAENIMERCLESEGSLTFSGDDNGDTIPAKDEMPKILEIIPPTKSKEITSMIIKAMIKEEKIVEEEKEKMVPAKPSKIAIKQAPAEPIMKDRPIQLPPSPIEPVAPIVPIVPKMEEPKIVEEVKNPGRTTFTEEKKIQILLEQRATDISNNKLEEKYNLSKGQIGKWKISLTDKLPKEPEEDEF